jgi:hypothetical protein
MNRPGVEMWRALLDFRAPHGRYWKRALLAKWMNGSDELEPFSSSLRMLRNQFGPSWLCALRPAILDAAGHRIAQLDRLPAMCATRLPGTGETIVLKRGEAGYWPLPEGWTIDRFNAAFDPTPAQIAAMEAGSMIGWDVPAADPTNYDSTGRPLRPGAQREGGSGETRNR